MGSVNRLSCMSPWHPVRTRFWRRNVSADFPFPALLDDLRAGNLRAPSGTFMQQVFMEPPAAKLNTEDGSYELGAVLCCEWIRGSMNEWKQEEVVLLLLLSGN